MRPVVALLGILSASCGRPSHESGEPRDAQANGVIVLSDSELTPYHRECEKAVKAAVIEATTVVPAFATAKVIAGLRWEPDADIWLDPSPKGFELFIKRDSPWMPSLEKSTWMRTTRGSRVTHSMYRGMGSAKLRFMGWSPDDEAAIAGIFRRTAEGCVGAL